MDIRCTTKPGNGWFEIRTENTTDFAPNGGGLVREIGFSYFREIRWLVKYYSIWVDGLFLFCIHSCWKCCIFVIWKHMSNKQKGWSQASGAISTRIKMLTMANTVRELIYWVMGLKSSTDSMFVLEIAYTVYFKF